MIIFIFINGFCAAYIVQKGNKLLEKTKNLEEITVINLLVISSLILSLKSGFAFLLPYYPET